MIEILPTRDFFQVNQLPQIDSHLTAKLYVDNAISDGVNKQSLLKLDPDEKLEQDSIFPNSTLTSPKTKIELPTKNYVHNKFNDPSIIKNTDHVDFNAKNLYNVDWIKVNKMPAVENHLTLKLYLDRIVRYIKPFIDGLQEISRNRRDLSSVFNDRDNEFDSTKLTNLDNVPVDRNPSSDNEVSNKNYVDDSIGEGTLLRFNQTLQNYLKVTVGNTTYNLTK